MAFLLGLYSGFFTAVRSLCTSNSWNALSDEMMSATGLQAGFAFARFAIPLTHISENASGVRGSFLHPSTRRPKSAKVDSFILSSESLSFDADSRNSSGESVARHRLIVFSILLMKLSGSASLKKPIRAMACVGHSRKPAWLGFTQLWTA